MYGNWEANIQTVDIQNCLMTQQLVASIEL